MINEKIQLLYLMIIIGELDLDFSTLLDMLRLEGVCNDKDEIIEIIIKELKNE